MTLIKPQESGPAPAPQPTAEPSRAAGRTASAAVIPFPGREARRSRRILRSGDRTGEILLFLGVRYERLAS